MPLTEGKWKGGNGAVKKQKSSKRPTAPPAGLLNNKQPVKK